MHEATLAANKLKGKSILSSTSAGKLANYEDIQDSLTGWARVVSYRHRAPGPLDASHFELDSVTEGSFTQGKKDGYCRTISAIDGTCSAGHHVDDVV